MSRATPRNSPPQMVSRLVASAHESPAPTNLFPFRFLPGSKPSSPSAQLDPQCQTHAASPLTAQSLRQTGLPSPIAVAANHFPARVKLVSINSRHVAAIHPAQSLSPDNRRLLDAAHQRRSSPYPAPKPSARESCSPDRALDRKSTRLNSSHIPLSRMPSS